MLFSNRFRSIVRHLRESLGPNSPGSTVAIMVPSGLICYILWQLLCFLQPVWQRKPVSQMSLNQIVQRMTQQPVGERRACVRYHAGLMNQDELSQIEKDIRQLQVLVVVVCTDTQAVIPPGTFAGCNMLCWGDRLCRSAFSLLGRKSRLTFMYENWDSHASSRSWSNEAGPPSQSLPPTGRGNT